jgi:hypothetical protein
MRTRVYQISRKEVEKRSANAMDIKHLCNGSRKNEIRWHRWNTHNAGEVAIQVATPLG